MATGQAAIGLARQRLRLFAAAGRHEAWLAQETSRRQDAVARQFATRRDVGGIDEALDLAIAETRGPVVLADVADNAGGGAPGDSTSIRRRILERGLRKVTSGLYWDPIAVRFCREAGEGAKLNLRIGGKVGRSSGSPLDLTVTVRKLASGITQRFGDVPLPIGDAAWVSADGVDIVLNALRTQVFHPESMTALGIDLSSRRVIVVKSTNHFYAGFASMAARVIHVAAPGALEQRFDRIALTKREPPYWPKVEDAFGEGSRSRRVAE